MEKPGQSAKANPLRLDKFLASRGIGSRREVVKLVKQGLVKVNGKVVKDPTTKVLPEADSVEVNGKKLNMSRHFYFKFYKPAGYITSTSSKDGICIFEVLPEEVKKIPGLFPVGRLDKDAEGLLLLTTDGTLAHRLMHPKWKLQKVYWVRLNKPLSKEHKILIEQGIELSDGKTLPCNITYLNLEKALIEVTVYEGRYHLVKRLFKKFGYQVTYLKRIKIGNISLGDLKIGEVKPVTYEELKELRRLLKLD